MEEIKIPDPSWGSELANIILDLEKLRTKNLGGDVPPYIFFQLKDIFHILETLGSARIEGNNTTLAEYVEKIIENEEKNDESNDEIKNLERAIAKRVGEDICNEICQASVPEFPCGRQEQILEIEDTTRKAKMALELLDEIKDHFN